LSKSKFFFFTLSPGNCPNTGNNGLTTGTQWGYKGSLLTHNDVQEPNQNPPKSLLCRRSVFPQTVYYEGSQSFQKFKSVFALLLDAVSAFWQACLPLSLFFSPSLSPFLALMSYAVSTFSHLFSA
jgi:hypothetical protein